jgi:hypothetical protein
VEKFDLSQNAVLVRLNIGQAGLTAFSRTLSDEAAEKHEADRDSVRGVVQKLKPADRKEITRAINAARAVFYFNTLPWDNGAYRLCPLVLYDSLRRELSVVEEAFGEAVEDLVGRYDQLAKDYKRRVNDLASEVPFPSRQELATNFNFQLVEMPIANPAKVVLNNLGEAQLEELRSRVTADIDQRLEAAGHDIVFRLIELVQKLRVQAGKDPKDTRFHKSLITNIEEAVTVLPKLNVTDNPEISRLITRVKNELASLDVADLKGNAKVRTKTEKVTSTILKDLKSYR